MRYQLGDELKLELGRGGWAALSFSTRGQLVAAVRFERRGERLIPGGTYLPGPITGDSLARLPMRRMEAMANAPGWREEIGRQIDADGYEVAAETRAWVDRMLKGDPDVPRAFSPTRRARRAAMIHGLRLTIPKPKKGQRGHGDEFYKTVARVYAYAASRSAAPAKEIAEASGVPPTTVRRWVKEARARGHLGPGRTGAAG